MPARAGQDRRRLCDADPRAGGAPGLAEAGYPARNGTVVGVLPAGPEGLGRLRGRYRTWPEGDTRFAELPVPGGDGDGCVVRPGSSVSAIVFPVEQHPRRATTGARRAGRVKPTRCR